MPFHENIKKNAAAKVAIGKAAALCTASESIIIDGGSTLLQMSPRLEGLELLVATNSLHIVSALLLQKKMRLYLPAGALFREQHILLSPLRWLGTLSGLQNVHGRGGYRAGGADADGCDIAAGERRLMARASNVVLLVDTGNSGGQVLCRKDSRMIKRMGVELIVAETSAESR